MVAYWFMEKIIISDFAVFFKLRDSKKTYNETLYKHT